MKDESVDWESIHAQIQEDRRSRLSDRPTLEDALALGRGELSDERRQHLVEWASVDAEIAQMVQDVLRFGEGIPESREAIAPETEEEAARRRSFCQRLEREGVPRLGSRSAPAVAEPERLPRRSSRNWWPMAASFLLGALLTVLGSFLWQPSAPTIWANPTSVHLAPEGSSAIRSGAVTVVPVESQGLAVTLVAEIEVDGAGPFRAELSGPGGSRVVSGLVPGRGDTFHFSLARELLADGPLEITLIDREGRTVATYRTSLDLQ